MWTCSQCGYTSEDDATRFCGHCGAARATGDASAFDVVLTSVDPAKKINAIRVVRLLTNCGLKEAKDFIESPPHLIGTTLTAPNADKLCAHLNAAGACCAIHPHPARLPLHATEIRPLQNEQIPAGNFAAAPSGCVSSIVGVLAMGSLMVVAIWYMIAVLANPR